MKKIVILVIIIILSVAMIYYVSTKNEIFKIIEKNKYGYSFLRANVNISENEEKITIVKYLGGGASYTYGIQNYRIVETYADFLEKVNDIQTSFQSYYDYETKARERYTFSSDKKADIFDKNEFNKIELLKNEINEEYFQNKNIIFIDIGIEGIRVLNSYISNVEEIGNTANVTINLNHPEKVSFVSKGGNVHAIYVNKQITNVNITRINE